MCAPGNGAWWSRWWGSEPLGKKIGPRDAFPSARQERFVATYWTVKVVLPLPSV